jgi:hypothetical protein
MSPTPTLNVYLFEGPICRYNSPAKMEFFTNFEKKGSCGGSDLFEYLLAFIRGFARKCPTRKNCFFA